MTLEPPDSLSLAGTSAISVSALNQAVARMLERGFPLVWISGEISNFTRAASGHWYFTLKDDAAQVRAVMFRGRAQYAAFTPADGDRVEVRALVTLYAPRGDYQLNVEAIRRAGLGDLHEAFLRLKAKLSAEGLLDANRKRPLPRFVKTLGIITSAQGAALHDVLVTLKRRAAHVRIIIYPTPVQGDGAAQKIAAAVALACARADADLLLLCRGGGSSEDLSAFNDENLARTLAAASLPVIAGIGHETDVTIADLVADLRAATPTAAAELATLATTEWLSQLQTLGQQLRRAMQRALTDRAQLLDWLTRRLQNPANAMRAARLRLANLHQRLTPALRMQSARARLSLLRLQARHTAQTPAIDEQRQRVIDYQRRLQQALMHGAGGVTARQHRLQQLTTQLELLNPQRTLERGYAILTDRKGRVLRSPRELQPREHIKLQLAEGSAEIGIASVQPSID